MQPYCRVAIDSPVRALDRPFDYVIPERFRERISVGSVVRVVLHGRNVRAFVIELIDEPAVADPRPLSSLVSPEPIFDAETIRLAAWTARRYVVPLGLVLHDAVPGRFSAPASANTAGAKPRTVYKPRWLTGEMAEVIGTRSEACVVLPHASDEPELVAHLVSLARVQAMRTLVICPRVQVAETIAAAIDGAAVLHAEDRPAERAAAWAAARDGRIDTLVGARSALFAPLPGLGLVVVTSAHDRSLKSERAPRLHALEVARQRARATGCTFVASSAAPPLDVASDVSVRVESKRSRVRPETARPRAGPITPRLLDVVRWALDRGTHALVFAGRRGDVLRLRCADCGWTPTCAVCGSGLALPEGRLVCRVCGGTSATPERCTSCAGALTQRGWGHERIARELERAALAPVVRVVAGEPLGELPEPTIVVGTIAAVHAVSEVGAVCVADLDQLLRRPDFRASELALQTLHDIAGVLAPGGRFLIQTREPEHHVVQAFTRGSYRYFLERELPYREETGYPPYGVVIRVEIEESLIDGLRTALAPTDARVVGTLQRRGKVSALVRAPTLEPLLDPLRRFSLDHPRVKIDVDPIDIT